MLEIIDLGRISFQQGLILQEDLVRQVQAGERGDVLLLLEHDPIYTIGRTRDTSSLKNPDDLPHEVVQINRGGQATFHGPGQLVGYPILNLAAIEKDLHRYLRFIEEFLIRLANHYEIQATRIDGKTGVWVGECKLASIGVGVRQWVSMHGFALNVGEDLSGFNAIIPCGLAGVSMTSLSKEMGANLPLQEVSNEAAALFRQMHAEAQFQKRF